VRLTVIVALVGWLLFPAAALAGWPKAARQVKLGIEQFEAGDYAAAGKAFAEAEAAAPHDMRIAFDRACAYAAEGKQAEAVEWFQKAALAEDPKLASRCRYNLGCLSVERARAALGQKPEEAKPDARPKALAALETAIGHFRGALELDPEDVDARHNAEAARLWIAHIKEVWRKRDAQEKRDKMDLLGYLKMLDTRQRSLRLTGKGLAKAPRSARQRQQVYQSAKQQSYLVEEIEPLKAKIQAAVQQPPATRPGTQPAGQPGAQPGAGPQPQPQTAPQADPKKAMQVLGGLADNAGKAMQAAAEELHNNAPAAAVGVQAEAVEKLDEVYTVLAPYVALVQTAVEKQQALVGQSAQACGKKDKPEPEQEAAEVDDSQEQAPRADRPPVDRPPVDLAESAWNQRFITGYSDMIRAKAQQGLKNMPPPPPKQQQQAEDQPNAAAAVPPLPPGVKPSESDDRPPEKADAADALKRRQEAALKQQEAMRKAMQNAVKYAPKVRTLTLEATDQLEDGRPGLALPKPEEALELLKKMLPEQPQNQNQQQQQQQQQDQNKDKKDRQKNKDKDKDKKDEDKQDQGNQDKDKQDDKKQDQDQKDQQSQQQQARQPRDLSKQQADAVLRKARQRQQEKRKLEKALQLHLYRPGKVEKDW